MGFLFRILGNDPTGEEAKYGFFIATVLSTFRGLWSLTLGVFMLFLSVVVLVLGIQIFLLFIKLIDLFTTDIPFIAR